MVQAEVARPPTSSARLSARQTERLSFDQIRLRLPRKEQRLLDNLLKEGGREFAIGMGQVLLDYKTALAKALETAGQNVCTENTAAYLDILERFCGPRAVTEVVAELLPIPPSCSTEHYRRLVAGRIEELRNPINWVTLEEYNRVIEAVAVKIGRPDIHVHAAARIQEKNFGPGSDIVLSSQQFPSIRVLYALAHKVVVLFNNTKKYLNVRFTEFMAVINSIIDDDIVPELDLWSRDFVRTIMRLIPLVAYEIYLRDSRPDLRDAGFGAMLAKFQEHNPRTPVELRDPMTLSGKVFSDGIWQQDWWHALSDEERRVVPRKFAADCWEACLQFDLEKTIEFYRQWASKIDHPFDIRNVYVQGRELMATVNGVETVIARRADYTLARGEVKPRPLRPNDDANAAPWLVLVDLLWCDSVEYGPIYVAQKGQLFNMRFTQWRFTWQKPPAVPLRLRIASAQRYLKRALNKPRALVDDLIRMTSLTVFGPRSAVRRAERATEARYANLRQERDRRLTEIRSLVKLSREQVNDVRDGWIKRFLEQNERVTVGHAQRVPEWMKLFVAYLAGLTLPECEAVFTGNIPDHHKNDQRFIYFEQTLEDLEWGAWIHDIGKLAIPEEILGAPRRLNDEEALIMKGHVILGRELALRFYPQRKTVIEWSMMHHENEDGSGYPQGLSTPQILLPAKILHIVDVWDACSGERPYRKPHPSIPDHEVAHILFQDAAKGKVHGWLTYKFIEFIYAWVRPVLVPKTAPELRRMGLNEEIIAHLHKVGQPNPEYDELGVQTLAEARRAFADQPLALTWTI